MFALSCSELKHFCETVSDLRQKHGLSKTAMAKILGISPSSLNKLENGVMPRISSEVVKVFGSVLGKEAWDKVFEEIKGL